MNPSRESATCILQAWLGDDLHHRVKHTDCLATELCVPTAAAETG